MQGFADLAALQDALDRLIERDLVLRIARRPGQKEERYLHRLSEDAEGAPAVEEAPEPLVAAPPRPSAVNGRVEALESERSRSCARRSPRCAPSCSRCATSWAPSQTDSPCANMFEAVRTCYRGGVVKRFGVVLVMLLLGLAGAGRRARGVRRTRRATP